MKNIEKLIERVKGNKAALVVPKELFDMAIDYFNDDYFTEYIKELIDDCYEMPKEINSGRWPYNHITVDYESAAEEAKQDYLSVDYDGATFWIKA